MESEDTTMLSYCYINKFPIYVPKFIWLNISTSAYKKKVFNSDHNSEKLHQGIFKFRDLLSYLVAQ